VLPKQTAGGIAVDLYSTLFYQMEWDLHFSPIGYAFHLGILITQIILNHVYIDAMGSQGEPLINSSKKKIAGFKSALF
jgi:hypothetical protein